MESAQTEPSYSRYKRQIVLPEVGFNGQKALLKSTIAVVGCGGIASSVIQILAAAGIGKLLLFDDDKIELSNLNRQTIFNTMDVGRCKSLQAAAFAKRLNPNISVQGISERINQSNFGSCVQDVDLIVDCTDRLMVKMFLNEASVEFNKSLIHTSAIGFLCEITTIQSGGRPCLNCLFEDDFEKKVMCNTNCANAGILGPTCSFIGSLAANEVIKILLNIESNFIGKLLRVDLKLNKFQEYKFEYNPNCHICSV